MWKKIFSGKKDEELKEENNNVLEDLVKDQETLNEKPPQVVDGETKNIESKVEEGTQPMESSPTKEKTVEKKLEESLISFKPRIRGNDYCPCESNKKFKKCCSQDEKKKESFLKKYDIRLENLKTIKNLRNEEIKKKKIEKEK